MSRSATPDADIEAGRQLRKREEIGQKVQTIVRVHPTTSATRGLAGRQWPVVAPAILYSAHTLSSNQPPRVMS